MDKILPENISISKDAKSRARSRSLNFSNIRREKLDEHVEQIHIVAEALLEYIDALPEEVVAELPAMPGINRDYVEAVMRGETV